jgi:hypothetical protein
MSIALQTLGLRRGHHRQNHLTPVICGCWHCADLVRVDFGSIYDLWEEDGRLQSAFCSLNGVCIANSFSISGVWVAARKDV